MNLEDSVHGMAAMVDGNCITLFHGGLAIDRTDIFPNLFASRVHFKKHTAGAVTDQRIAIGQAMRPGNVVGIEIGWCVSGVSPGRGCRGKSVSTVSVVEPK